MDKSKVARFLWPTLYLCILNVKIGFAAIVFGW